MIFLFVLLKSGRLEGFCLLQGFVFLLCLLNGFVNLRNIGLVEGLEGFRLAFF